VLKRYLQEAGFPVEIVSVASTEEMLNCHFVLLGHGSQAAMASLEPHLTAIDWKLIMAKVPGMSVGSTVEWLATRGVVPFNVVKGPRVSEFQVGKFGGISVLGYRNTDTNLANLELSGQFITTMLHGPVLAKNPKLLHRAAVAAIKCAGLEFPKEPNPGLRDWVSHLNRISAQIWEIETDEKFEALEL